MNISSRLVDRILDSGSNHENQFSAGELIQTTDNSSSIILILNGAVRYIDNSKSFNSYTIKREHAPLLIGIPALFGFKLEEQILATEDCSLIFLEFNDLSTIVQTEIHDLAKLQPEPSEYPLIKEALVNNNICQRDYLNSYLDIEREISPITDLCGDITENSTFIYLDKDSKGFDYGQLITSQIISLAENSLKSSRIFAFTRKSTNRVSLETKTTSTIRSNQTILRNKSATETPDSDTNNTLFDQKSDQEEPADLTWSKRLCDSRRDTYAICIDRLCKMFDIPIRNDNLQKISKYMDKDNVNWPLKVLPILDNIGFACRTVDLKNTGSKPRFSTPSLWIDSKGNCSLLVESKLNKILFFNPLEGENLYTQESLYEQIQNAPTLISIDRGLHAPQNNFNVAWLFPYIKKYKLQFIEIFSASFLNQIFALATPLLFQQIIDRVISKGSADSLPPFTFLMITFAILEISFASLKTFQFVEITNRIDISLGSSIVSRLLRVNAKFFDRRPVGELSSRLGELDNIRRFLTGTALTVVLDSLFSLLYFGVMYFYSPILTLVVLITIPFLVLVTVGITPITQKLIRRRAEASARTQSLMVELLSGIQTIKLQSSELDSRRRWEDRHLNTINQGFKAVIANTTSSNALQLINKLSNIAIIGVGASLVLENKLTLGQLIAFRIISGYVTQPLLRLASSWQSFQEMSLSLERVGDIVNQPLEIDAQESGNIQLPPIKGSLFIDSVTYAYSSSSPSILNSVSLKVDPGSFVGFVGQSGCGKSTLLKLIPRLYIPTTGKVYIDGYDISKVDLYSYRRQLGFVPQDCMLFEGTIFSNIAMGNDDASTELVVEMAQLACAHEFIMNLPYGYNTPIGEKGAGLSGGQRQRIALARMFLENPSMLILDEATSALDVDTERRVIENIKNHFESRTVLMITHRISSLNEADNIVVMHSGSIDSMGTHEELLNAQGRYFALYNSQFAE